MDKVSKNQTPSIEDRILDSKYTKAVFILIGLLGPCLAKWSGKNIPIDYSHEIIIFVPLLFIFYSIHDLRIKSSYSGKKTPMLDFGSKLLTLLLALKFANLFSSLLIVDFIQI